MLVDAATDQEVRDNRFLLLLFLNQSPVKEEIAGERFPVFGLIGSL